MVALLMVLEKNILPPLDGASPSTNDVEV